MTTALRPSPHGCQVSCHVDDTHCALLQLASLRQSGHGEAVALSHRRFNWIVASVDHSVDGLWQADSPLYSRSSREELEKAMQWDSAMLFTLMSQRTTSPRRNQSTSNTTALSPTNSSAAPKPRYSTPYDTVVIKHTAGGILGVISTCLESSWLLEGSFHTQSVWQKCCSQWTGVLGQRI